MKSALNKNFKFEISNLKAGFTLVELLVVIAILGILAAVLLVGVNPLEQLARGRDSSRKSIVAQLGHGMEAYVTNQSQSAGSTSYYATSATWQDTLVGSSDIKTTATAPAISGRNCGTATNRQGDVCYTPLSVGTGTNNDGVIWTLLESKAEWTRAGCTGTQVVVAAWIAGQGKAGVTCVTNDATAPAYNAVLK